MSRGRPAIAVAGVTLPVVPWAVLLFGLGNIGLQQSISIGPQVLIDPYVGVTLLAAGASVVEAAALTFACDYRHGPSGSSWRGPCSRPRS
jgi:hypothetical protein